jgi:transcriptional regulator with XRE-family HTH domain
VWTGGRVELPTLSTPEKKARRTDAGDSRVGPSIFDARGLPRRAQTAQIAGGAPVTDAGKLSVAALALAVIGKKQGFARVAQRIRVSEAAARHYARGRRTPKDAVQARIAKAYAVAPGDWTTYSAPETAEPGPGPDGAAIVRPMETGANGAAETSPPDAHDDRPLLERYQELARTLEATMRAAKADVDTPSRDVAQIGQALNRTYRGIAELTGEGEISMTAIVRSRAWRSLLERIAPVLERAPDVAKAIAEALEDGEEP